MLGKLLLIMVIGSGYIIYLENTPEYKSKLVYEATVVETGCTTGSYKGHITYDCSVKLDNGKREIIKLGVLVDDKIGYYCRRMVL